MKDICGRILFITKRIGQIILSIISIVLLVFLFLFIASFEKMNVTLHYRLYYGGYVA